MNKLRHNTPVFRPLRKYDHEFEEFLEPELPYIRINKIENLYLAEKELYKALDENQKVCYNRLVDLCEN